MMQSTLPTIDVSPSAPRINVRPDAPWMPDSVRRRIEEHGRLKHTTGFSRAERRVLRKKPRIAFSELAEKFRWVRISSREGQWSNSTTPYLAGIMDAIGKSCVRDVTICAAPQTGKTEAAYNCLGCWIDRAPGPALIVFADEQTAKDEKDERLQVMIDDSPILRSYKTKAARDSTTLRLTLQHMVVHMAWATSVARLATKPKRYVIFDEVDKYPESLRKETDPISLGIKRTRTYSDDRKVIRLSTPTWEQGPIWQSLIECQAVFHFWVRCPDCLRPQLMQFGDKDTEEGIKWPEDERDPNTIETNKLAWYQCRHCGSKWDDYLRDRAVRLGEWREANSGRELMTELQLKKSARIGFQIPAWLSTFVSLSECAASFLRGQENKIKLRDFMNSIKAEPWREYEVEREEDDILALADDRPRGIVPDQADVLLAGIDTQDNGFWYEIRAFKRGRLLESWQIREGFIPADWSKVDPEELENRPYPYHPAFDGLRQILFEDEYLTADEEKNFPVTLAGIDAMGHHTTEVYDFCRYHRQVKPIQGGKKRSNRPFKWSKIDTYPGSNRTIPGGIWLLQLDVNYFKDELSSKLQIASLDPGAWHLHSETGRDWARHLCAEYLDEKSNRWVCPEHKPNHGWDCSVYNFALAEVAGLKYEQKAEKPVKKEAKKEQKDNPYTQGKNLFGENYGR